MSKEAACNGEAEKVDKPKLPKGKKKSAKKRRPGYKRNMFSVEYIHAALSTEKKLVVMLYGEGSRSHEIQEDKVFKDSSIRIFTADRAKLYETIYLFYLERYAKSKNYTFDQRLALRLRYSRKVVSTIMKTLERMKNDKKANYGRLVMRAINYVLDDREAFQVFLTNGMVEIHNIAIERCFRHIANGRRNWLQNERIGLWKVH